jgi:hypothetical protein
MLIHPARERVAHQVAATETSVLFELIAERYERRSMITTCNQTFSDWNQIFPDPAMTSRPSTASFITPPSWSSTPKATGAERPQARPVPAQANCRCALELVPRHRDYDGLISSHSRIGRS